MDSQAIELTVVREAVRAAESLCGKPLTRDQRRILVGILVELHDRQRWRALGPEEKSLLHLLPPPLERCLRHWSDTHEVGLRGEGAIPPRIFAPPRRWPFTLLRGLLQ